MAESREYVVLTRPSTKSLSMMRAGAGEAASEPPKVEVMKLQDREAAEIRRDPDKAAAPAMPLALIQPRARGDEPAQHPGDLTWGLQALGVNRNTLTGEGITVAVLDTGIDKEHEAFAHIRERIKIADFTGEGEADEDGHGTHCAGTIFGSTVNGTRIGVAPGIQRALVGKVIGKNGSSTVSLMKGIQWSLDSGAHIISMSLGIDFPGFAESLIKAGYPRDIAFSRALQDYRDNLGLFEAIAELIQSSSYIRQPTIVVAAAGNESRGDEDPVLPDYLWAV